MSFDSFPPGSLHFSTMWEQLSLTAYRVTSIFSLGRRGFYGLSLWVSIAYASKILAAKTTDVQPLHQTVANHYASYLLGYAIWIGQKIGSFDPSGVDGSGAKKNLPGTEFTHIKRCQDVIDFIVQFYLDPRNPDRAQNFVGRFYSELPKDRLIMKLQSKSLLLDLSEKWGTDREQLKLALDTINQTFEFPPSFLEEESQQLREFWNFAFIGVVTETVCKWSAMDERLKSSMLWVYLTTCTGAVRALVAKRKIYDF